MSNPDVNDDDVVVISSHQSHLANQTLKVSKLKEWFMSNVNSHIIKEFLSGLRCEYLRTDGGGWKKGHIRISVHLSVEFVPDIPKSIKQPPGAITKVDGGQG